MQATYALGALALLFAVSPVAGAAGLSEVWQAAVQNDRELAVAHASQAAAQPRLDQAGALWRPQVALSATLGLATSETETRGAQFSAPGFGQSNGVGFNTSVTNGGTGRWAVSAVQPLYNPARRAQQQQLRLSGEVAELEWQAARQALMLRTAQRYFEVALAEESARVLTQQLEAVQRATTEVKDRFELGSVPVTDTHEARARLAGVQAQLLAAQTDLQIKRGLLADSTGLPAPALDARLPATAAAAAEPRALEQWQADAQTGNPGIRMRLIATDVARQEVTRYGARAAPQVDLVAQASRERLSGSGDFGSAANTATNRMIGVQLSMPIFTGGYRSAQEHEALRGVDKAAAQADLTRQQVAQEVRAAWLGLSVGAQRVQALAESLSASEARRDATRVGQQIGDRTTQDLLDAENEHAATRLALAQARVGLVMERLRLAALTGQLDDAALRALDTTLEPAPQS